MFSYGQSKGRGHIFLLDQLTNGPLEAQGVQCPSLLVNENTAYGRTLPVGEHCLWENTACGRTLPMAEHTLALSVTLAELSHSH